MANASRRYRNIFHVKNPSINDYTDLSYISHKPTHRPYTYLSPPNPHTTFSSADKRPRRLASSASGIPARMPLLFPEILPRRHAYMYSPDLSRPYIGIPTCTHIYPETGLNRERRIYPGNRLVSRACRRCIIYKTALNCLCRNGDSGGGGGGFWLATLSSSGDIYEPRLDGG